MKKVKDGWMIRIFLGSHPEDGEHTLRKVYESREDAEKALSRFQLNYSEDVVHVLTPIKFISK